MKCILNLPQPHSREQRIMFQAFSCPGLLEAWFACGTKFGKSAGSSIGLVSAAWIKKDALFRWVAPIHSQATIGMKYHERILPEETRSPNQSKYRLLINHNKTVIEYKSGKHPEDLEGEGVTGGYGLDEAAKMKRQVYDSAKTTVTVTRAPIIGFSTPKGKNWFYNKCMEAKEEMDWCLANGTAPTKIFVTAPSTVNPMVSAAAIEDMRKSLPDRLFRQYVLAEFVDDGSTFLGFRECYYTDKIEMFTEHQAWFGDECAKSQVVIGVDWAKTIDWTVFIAMDIVTRKMIAFERFHKRAYTQAIRQLVKFASRFEDVLVVYHDKTGVGQAIDDQLAYTKLPYVGITFTNTSKTNMVNSLITAVETKQIGLVQWNVLDSELDAYEVSTNELGTMTYGAPDGQHDDAVCSLMLANSALEKYADRDMGVRFLEDLKEDTEVSQSELDAYYNEMREEDF